MRSWILALVFLAGCTVEVGRPGTPSPGPAGTPRPAATPRATPVASPSAAATATPTPAPTPASDAVVLRYARTGSNCPFRPCDSYYTFRADGRYELEDGPAALERGSVDVALIARLQDEVARADFAAIKARKFTGQCPTVVDGSELIYTFPLPIGEETLAACTYDLSHGPAVALIDLADALVDATIVREPSPAPTPATPPPGPTIGPDDTVLVLRRAGGRCVYGGCESTVAFKADGRYTWTRGPNERGEGRVDQALTAALNTEIYRTDFAALKARPFTGTCPPAYDGQELTYTFGTPRGEEVLPGCTYEIDEAHPLIAAALALDEAASPQP